MPEMPQNLLGLLSLLAEIFDGCDNLSFLSRQNLIIVFRCTAVSISIHI